MRWRATILVLAGLSATARGVVRFPPPQFSKPYDWPHITTPAPGERPGLYDFAADTPPMGRYFDAVILSAVLALAAYVVMVKASPAWLVGLIGFVLIYFGLWHQACAHLPTAQMGPWGPAGLLALAIPLAAAWASLRWARRHGRTGLLWLALGTAWVHVGTWHDGIAGSWGLIRRTVWTFTLLTRLPWPALLFVLTTPVTAWLVWWVLATWPARRESEAKDTRRIGAGVTVWMLAWAVLAGMTVFWLIALGGTWVVVDTPTLHPTTPAIALEYFDVVLLTAAILLAAWLALKARNRKGITALLVFSLLHFGFWRQGCICPIGAIQTCAAAIASRSYVISIIVVLFLLIPLVLTLIWGRSFCGAVCPLGAIQDLVILRPLRVPAWLGHALGLLAWVYLGLAVLLAAVGSAFVICHYDPFVALFRLDGSAEMLLLGAAFLVLGLFVARPYCRFLCPLGAMFRVLGAASARRVAITPAECVQCKLCEDSCPFGAIRPANADQPTPPRHQGRGPLAGLLLLLPVLVAGGAWLVGLTAPALARTHEMVLLAEQVAAERSAGKLGATDATAALAAMAKSDRQKRIKEIVAEARGVQESFQTGTRWLGAFLGLVVGLKLIGLSVRRRRTDYTADPATCLSCGRCYATCPIHHREKNQTQRE